MGERVSRSLVPKGLVLAQDGDGRATVSWHGGPTRPGADRTTFGATGKASASGPWWVRALSTHRRARYRENLEERPTRLATRAFIVLAAALVAACAAIPATKGTMPPPDANGWVDPSLVPDFVMVAGPDGNTVGYAKKEAVFDLRRAWPVYGDDLRTIVGQLVPGLGFVPSGVDPDSITPPPASLGPIDGRPVAPYPGVVVYVRNDSARDAWVAVLDGGGYRPGAGGFRGGSVGSACFDAPAGSRVVLLSGAPWEPGIIAVVTVFESGVEEAGANRFVVIGPDDSVSVGRDVPPWWTSDPPSC